jgi:uncharacterized membrane protein
MSLLTANPGIPTATRARIASIDLLRGLIMIIMALDHVRDYFHADSLIYSPTDLSKTTGILFFTRWITHYCAPLFMFLSGTSASFVGERKTIPELSSFLLKRGIWLIFLEFTVVRLGWYFNLFAHEFDFIVIWALGFSMVVLGLLVRMPRKFILVFGLLLVFGHNLLDTVRVSGGGIGSFLWSLVHVPNFVPWHGYLITTIYPVVPWIGVMALGYCLGSLYTGGFPAERRRPVLLWLGFAAIALFIVIRYINHYGDPSPWKARPSALFTVLSFINTSKYPPSLLYLLMTLGPALLFLAWSESAKGWFSRQVMIYGRVPMFYYILHIYLLHLIAVFATTFCGHSPGDMILDHFIGLADAPRLNGYGFSLGVTYAVWAFVVLALYLPCRWYDRYKRAHKEKWWLSYI